MAEFLDIQKIERAFDALFSANILTRDKGNQEDLRYPIDKEDYISVCAEFTFNAFNIGLREAAIYFEKAPKGSAVEQKRYQFCQALLFYLDERDKVPTLQHYCDLSSKSLGLLQHRIQEATNYLKLALKASQIPADEK